MYHIGLPCLLLSSSFDKLKSRIVSSIAMILMNIRDLIIVGGIVSEELATIYLPYVSELDTFMKRDGGIKTPTWIEMGI